MPSEKVILAFAGPLASGKDTAGNYFIEKYGAAKVKYSGPLRDMLSRLYLEHDRSNMQNLSTVLRGQFGQDLLSKVIARDAEQARAAVVVIDGVRRPSDITDLRKLSNFYLIAVTAPEEVRYERILKRGENPGEDALTREEFSDAHMAEAELEIPEVMKLADLTVDNRGTLAELQEQLETFYQKLRDEGKG